MKASELIQLLTLGKTQTINIYGSPGGQHLLRLDKLAVQKLISDNKDTDPNQYADADITCVGMSEKNITIFISLKSIKSKIGANQS